MIIAFKTVIILALFAVFSQVVDDIPDQTPQVWVDYADCWRVDVAYKNFLPALEFPGWVWLESEGARKVYVGHDFNRPGILSGKIEPPLKTLYPSIVNDAFIFDPYTGNRYGLYYEYPYPYYINCHVVMLPMIEVQP